MSERTDDKIISKRFASRAVKRSQSGPRDRVWMYLYPELKERLDDAFAQSLLDRMNMKRPEFYERIIEAGLDQFDVYRADVLAERDAAEAAAAEAKRQKADSGIEALTADV